VKVLVASSEALVRHMAATALSQAGFSVVRVCDGEEAWAEIDHETGPLIAVLDWQMPRYDGLTLCRTLRSLKFRDYVYVLLLTSRKNKMDELVALESGIDDYLQKPFLADELLARVNIGRRVVEHERKLSAIIGEFRAMADLSPFPTVCLDGKGIIRRMNMPFSLLVGSQPPVDLLGLNIADVLSIHRDDITHLLRHIQEERPIEHLPWNPIWKNPGAFPAPAAFALSTLPSSSFPATAVTAATDHAANRSAGSANTAPNTIAAGTTSVPANSSSPATWLPGNPCHIYGRPVPNHPTITYILTFTTALERAIISSNEAASGTKIAPASETAPAEATTASTLSS
jgi:two-component system chemotaxis response regulator CheY